MDNLGNPFRPLHLGLMSSTQPVMARSCKELFVGPLSFDEVQKGPNASIGVGEDETALGHLKRCEGCENCDYLMRDYSACDTCGHWMHHSQPHHYDEGSGETLCLVCEPKEADL